MFKRVILSKRGASGLEICAYSESETAQSMAEDFLDELEKKYNKDFNKLRRMLYLASEAKSNIPNNEELCRFIEDGIYEFKANNGRLFWFFRRGGVLICTNGYCKQSNKISNRDKTRAKKFKKKIEEFLSKGV